MEEIVLGTWKENTARYVGKFAPSGPVSSMATAFAAAEGGIGAGVGALGAAVTHKSPLTGALLGGSLGGLGSAAGLFGGAAGAGAGTAGTAGLVGANGEIGSSLLSSAPALSGASYVTGAHALAQAAAKQSMGSSLLGNASQDGLLSQWGNAALNSMKNNPLGSMSSASNLYSSMMQHPQIQTPQGAGIKQGNPNLVANIPELLQTTNVAPTVLPSKVSKTGQIGDVNASEILKRIPISQLFNQETL